MTELIALTTFLAVLVIVLLACAWYQHHQIKELKDQLQREEKAHGELYREITAQNKDLAERVEVQQAALLYLTDADPNKEVIGVQVFLK